MQNSYNQLKRIFLKQIINFILIVFLFHTMSSQGNYLVGCSYFVYTIISLFSIIIFEITVKRISHFQIEGEYQNKKRFFSLERKTILKIGMISFFVLFFIAKPFANWLIKKIMLDVDLKNFTFLFQMSSLLALFLPLKNLYLAYFYAIKKEKEAFFADLIEEVIKVIGILGSIIICFQIDKWSNIDTAKLITFFLFLSCFFSFLFLFYLSIKKRKELEKETLKIEYTIIPNQTLNKMLKKEYISYSIFIIFPILYWIIDFLFLTEFLPQNFSFSEKDLETIFTSMTLWGCGLNFFLFSILSFYFSAKTKFSFLENEKRKMHLFLEKTISSFIPVTLFLIAVMNHIVFLIYEKNGMIIEITIFQLLILFFSILSLFSNMILLVARERKKIMQYLLLGFISKIILTLPLCKAINRLGLLACDGAFIATALGYGISSYLSFRLIGKKYQLNEEKMIRKILNIVLLSLGMVMILVFIGMKIQPTNRFISILYLLFCGFLLKVLFSIKEK